MDREKAEQCLAKLRQEREVIASQFHMNTGAIGILERLLAEEPKDDGGEKE